MTTTPVFLLYGNPLDLRSQYPGFEKILKTKTECLAADAARDEQRALESRRCFWRGVKLLMSENEGYDKLIFLKMFFWVANYHWLTSLLLPWASGVFGWSLWFRGWRGALLREHQNSRAGSCTCCEKVWWTCRAMLWGMNIQVFVVKTKVGRGWHMCPF